VRAWMQSLAGVCRALHIGKRLLRVCGICLVLSLRYNVCVISVRADSAVSYM
jgi:hypothetical protein